MKRASFICILMFLAGCAAQVQTGATRPATTRPHRTPLAQRVAREVEPSLHGRVDRLPFYLDVLHRELLKDGRAFAFNVHVDSPEHPSALVGYVEFAEQRRTIDAFLRNLHLAQLRDEIAVLPAATLGAAKFAVVIKPHVLVYDRPFWPRTALTDCRESDVLFLLNKSADQFLCHAANGYVGYVDATSVRPIASDEAQKLLNPPLSPPAAKQTEKIIAAGRMFIGTKYVWGGLTIDGIDCSGLVYCAYQSIGLTLARDADQQALAGRLVATRWFRSALRRGDLLYFLGRDGSIHHTAIYLGNQKFLEATEPAVKISSFDPHDKTYSMKRDKSFCFAKRLMTTAATTPPKPPMGTRAQWNSTPLPIADSRKQTPKFITIHHAGVAWRPGEDPVKYVKTMQTWGQREKHWPDLPYHFLIAPDGRIFEGRPVEYEPESNTNYDKNGHIGVELMGNFEVQRPSRQQLESCVKLVAWLCAEYHIAPSQIAGHRDRAINQTVCPGKDFYRYLQDGEFIGWVKQALAGNTPDVHPGPPLAGGPTDVINALPPASQPEKKGAR